MSETPLDDDFEQYKSDLRAQQAQKEAQKAAPAQSHQGQPGSVIDRFAAVPPGQAMTPPDQSQFVGSGTGAEHNVPAPVDPNDARADAAGFTALREQEDRAKVRSGIKRMAVTGPEYRRALREEKVQQGTLEGMQLATADAYDERAKTIEEDARLRVRAANAEIEEAQAQTEAEAAVTWSWRSGVEADLTKLNSLTEEEAKREIDPSRHFFRSSTGGRIMAGLSAAMFQFGQALMGQSGPNVAVQIIEKAIDDDISAQKANMTQGRWAIKERRSNIQEIRNLINDDEAFDQWNYAAKLEAGAKIADNMANLAKTEDQAFAARQVAEQIRTKVQAYRTSVAQKHAANKGRAHRAAVQQATPTPRSELLREGQEFGVKGAGKTSLTEEQANKIRAQGYDPARVAHVDAQGNPLIHDPQVGGLIMRPGAIEHGKGNVRRLQEQIASGEHVTHLSRRLEEQAKKISTPLKLAYAQRLKHLINKHGVEQGTEVAEQEIRDGGQGKGWFGATYGIIGDVEAMVAAHQTANTIQMHLQTLQKGNPSIREQGFAQAMRENPMGYFQEAKGRNFRENVKLGLETAARAAHRELSPGLIERISGPVRGSRAETPE